MVRAHMKQTPEEKKETVKKKSSTKKKVETGSWPCKINGCNKIFAREADLKRHQRTTKLHSLPGFACPQCEATFTRTDALRRHQKSRHNGVIIEPTEQEKGKPHNGSDSEAVSHGSSPAMPHQMPPPGTSHYYRPHTLPHGYPLPPGLIIDPHYQPNMVGLPTSATRGSWQHPPPPWVDGMYHVPPGYYASPYYRPPPPGMIPHTQMKHEFIIQGSSPGTAGTSPSSSGESSRKTQKHSRGGKSEGSTSTPPPVIDPSLDRKSDRESRPRASESKSVSLEMTEAAVQAVIESEKLREKEEKEASARKVKNGDDPASPKHDEQQSNDGGDESQEENPESTRMNLSELLTQESLASPPPS